MKYHLLIASALYLGLVGLNSDAAAQGYPLGYQQGYTSNNPQRNPMGNQGGYQQNRGYIGQPAPAPYVDPRLGYCLRNDCFGQQQNGSYSRRQGCGCGGSSVGRPTGRSRFIVRRNGQDRVVFVGTRAEFLQAYPEYRNRIVMGANRSGLSGQVSRPSRVHAHNHR